MNANEKMICAAILTAGLASNSERMNEHGIAKKFWKVLEELENEQPNSRYEADPDNYR